MIFTTFSVLIPNGARVARECDRVQVEYWRVSAWLRLSP